MVLFSNGNGSNVTLYLVIFSTALSGTMNWEFVKFYKKIEVEPKITDKLKFSIFKMINPRI